MAIQNKKTELFEEKFEESESPTIVEQAVLKNRQSVGTTSETYRNFVDLSHVRMICLANCVLGCTQETVNCYWESRLHFSYHRLFGDLA